MATQVKRGTALHLDSFVTWLLGRNVKGHLRCGLRLEMAGKLSLWAARPSDPRVTSLR